MVISRELTGLINLFVTFSTLKEHGVDKLFVLQNGNTDSSQRNIVYLVRGEKPADVQATAGMSKLHYELFSEGRIDGIEQIKKLQKNGTVEHEISIFWVPRRSLVSNKILEEDGILGDVNISEFPLYFLPLEDDLLSLELQDSFTELFLVSLYRV